LQRRLLSLLLGCGPLLSYEAMLRSLAAVMKKVQSPLHLLKVLIVMLFLPWG
jgi:hypothetical protein